MKRRKSLIRIAALLMACSLACAGPLARAEEADKPEDTASGILFRQSGYVQTADPKVGILSMELRVKPEDGKAVKSGYFAFEFDTSYLWPLVRTTVGGSLEPMEIPATMDVVAVGLTGPGTRYYDFIDPENGGLYVLSTPDIGTAIDWNQSDPYWDVDKNNSVYAISQIESTTGSSLLGAFLYFDFFSSTAVPVDSDGWATIATLYFSHTTPSGDEVPDTRFLNIKSFSVPENTAEANALLQRFKVSKTEWSTVVGGDGEEVLVPGATTYLDLAPGAAAYITADGDKYYNFAQPGTCDMDHDYTGAAALSGGPTLFYDGMDNRYTIEHLNVGLTNTFKADDSDFPTPAGQSGEFPRYTIPTKAQEEANGGNWLAYNYVGDGKTSSQAALKYEISTRVTINSVSRPELPVEEYGMGLENFLGELQWEFTAFDGTPLADLPRIDETEATTINGKQVSQATLSTAGTAYSEYDGYKVQIIREDSKVTVTPVGVTLDRPDWSGWTGSSVTWMDNSEGDGTQVTMTNLVPQLHITSQAGEPESVAWALVASEGNIPGMVYFRASFLHAGVTYYSDVTEVQLVRETSVPTQVLVDLSGSGEQAPAGSGAAASITVGQNVDISGTILAGDPVGTGVPVKACVYDQYGLPLLDRTVTFTIAPAAETEAEMTAAGKTNVFQMVYVDATTNKISYKPTYGPYNVYGGNYVITASCGGVDNEGQLLSQRTVQMVRPANFLYSISVSTSYGQIGYEVAPAATDWEVPIKKNGQNQTAYIDPFIRSINSQYAAPGTKGDGTKWVEDYVCNPDTTINMQDVLSRPNTDITFEWTLESGSTPREGSIVIDTNKSSQTYGRLTINSTATDCVILYKIHITYGGGDSGVPQVTKTAISRLRIYRAATRLASIQLDNVGTVIVPTPTQVTQNGATIIEVSASAYDQYGEFLDWSRVNNLYAVGSAINPGGPAFELKLSVAATTPLPSGVVQLTDGGFRFQVNSTAQTSSFKVSASYAQPGLSGTTSDLLTINIQRAKSVLSSIGPITYSPSTVVSPDKSSPATSTSPSYVFYDQYDVIMSDTSSIDLTWRVDSSGTTAIYDDGATANPEFQLDADTGVVTILPCARDGKTISVRLVARQANETGTVAVGRTATNAVAIRRLPAMVEIAEVYTESVRYPEYGTASSIKLQALSTSQYGEAELVTSESGISEYWTLVSVTTNTGVVMASNNVAANVTLYGTGSVNFARLQDPAAVARSMRVKVLLGNAVESIEKDIPILFDTSVATRIYVAAATTLLMPVPEATEGTASRELLATVQDQYGMNMGYTVDWSVGTFDDSYFPGAVRFIKRDGRCYLEVDSNAGECEVPLTAFHEGTGLSTECAIRVTKGNLVVTSVKIEVVDNDDVIDLPSQAEGSCKYTLVATVYDQYNFPMKDELVTWTASGSGATVGASTGVLTVPYTNAVRTSGSGAIQLGVSTVTNPAITDMKTITVAKATPVPTYAAWDLLRVTYKDSATNSVTTDEIRAATTTGTVQIVVPGRSDPDTEVELHGKVYSQYEEEMAGELPTWSILGEASGVTLAYDGATGVGKLTVTFAASGVMVELQAAPASAPDKTGNMTSGTKSNLVLYYEKGVPRATETEPAGDNSYTMELPKWDSRGDYHVDEGLTFTETYSLSAQIIDQYGRRMDATATYPVWELVENVPGLMLIAEQSDPRGQGRITGNSVDVMVDHDTLAEGELLRQIHIRVYADNEEKTSDLMKTLTIDLVKEQAVPSYIYWVNVDEDGMSQSSVEVPTKIEGSATYDLVATVYDQYGYVMEYDQLTVKPTWNFDQIESAYPGCTLTALNGGKVTEFSYNGYQMAALEHATGKLTIYYAATVPTLPLVASIGEAEVRGGVMPLNWAVLEPAVMDLEQDPYYDQSGELQEMGRIEMQGDAPIQAGITSVIYDQFGYVVEADQTVPDLHLYWEIWWHEDEGDPWEPYVEYYQDGSEKAPQDYTIKMLEDTPRKGILWVDHENVEENQYFLCLRAYAAYETDGTVTAVGNQVFIELFSNPFSGGPIEVYFDAGLHGKLQGASTHSIYRGRSLTEDQIPTVTPNSGYDFTGWTTDGRYLVDPVAMRIVRTITFTAVYQEDFDTVLGGGIIAENVGVPSVSFINGRDGGSLSLESQVTTAEFVKMVVVGMIGYDDTYDYGDNYADVPADAWYANYFACAKAYGLMEGEYAYPETFITRESAAQLLWAALGSVAPVSAETGFADVGVSNAIAALHEAGVVNGWSDGLFHPTSGLSRAEAITLVVRAQNLCSDAVLSAMAEAYGDANIPDVGPGHWAYPYVLSAAGYFSFSTLTT